MGYHPAFEGAGSSEFDLHLSENWTRVRPKFICQLHEICGILRCFVRKGQFPDCFPF
jgi:hypothetical protein